MQYIEAKDENGNHWKLETLPNEKYPHKGMLFITINDQKFKVMNFVTARERGLFWNLLGQHFKGEVKQAQNEVENAEDAN